MDTSPLEQAKEVLRRGGVVAIPTDTVYGLAASAYNEAAVARVYRIKQRPPHLPLPLLLAEVSQIGEVCNTVPPLAWHLARRFLPGGLTIILHKMSHISAIITGGEDKVGVRIPNHPIPIALIKGLGVPLTGTSANRSGWPSPLTTAEVREQLGDEVDMVIEGTCPGGRESTVIDLTVEPPQVLREGAISLADLEGAIAELKVTKKA